ncbi:hypothetical protein ACFSGX_11940 [Sphingomonas arantia]|uniref:Lipoyl-binding domain-containing protein n=1 Tax=Sphingomonas arantia TaxID=1460676 RepID=A0ABW4U097_9SPHN
MIFELLGRIRPQDFEKIIALLRDFLLSHGIHTISDIQLSFFAWGDGVRKHVSDESGDMITVRLNAEELVTFHESSARIELPPGSRLSVGQTVVQIPTQFA